MKIIAGQYRGKNFYMPKDVRPTQDVTRKAIFDILGQDLEGLEFLELFAGSGAVGLEAISRGAKRVTFVEKDPRCVEILNENLKLLTICDESCYEIINSDALAMIKRFAANGRKFDLIFLDPPYEHGLAKKALKLLSAYDILHPDSIILIEHHRREILPESEGRILFVKQKKYGSARLSIYKY